MPIPEDAEGRGEPCQKDTGARSRLLWVLMGWFFGLGRALASFVERCQNARFSVRRGGMRGPDGKNVLPFHTVVLPVATSICLVNGFALNINEQDTFTMTACTEMIFEWLQIH